LNQVIEQIFRSGYVEDAEGDVYQPASSITFETGALLYDFIRAFTPQKTLEVGMAYGISTLFICQALRDNGVGSHTAIDPLEKSEFKSIGLLNVERANLKHLLQFHEAPSDLMLPRLCAQNEGFDFAFIDGWHLFDFTLIDFYYIDKLLRVGGHVALDDLWMPAIRKVISFVLNNKPYKVVRIPSRCPAPLWKRALRVGRRVAQNPIGRDWRLNFLPNNVAFLQKISADGRSWRFHRGF